MPTGIPRPLSTTESQPFGSSVMAMKLANPATASSIELSNTSAKRWCIAASSVPPMYMPGRLRTGSSPSSTSIELALYSPGTEFLPGLEEAAEGLLPDLGEAAPPANRSSFLDIL